MYNRSEYTLREDRYKRERKNPSFSSSLLDKIYRSIDEGDRNHEDPKFCKETLMPKKQSKNGGKGTRAIEEEDMASLRRACLIEKWMDKKVSEKVVGTQQRRQYHTELDRKLDHDHDRDLDVLFFSSTSSSSDSSSGGFSSSDAESMYGSLSRPSCFAPARPKPVRTSVSTKPGKTEEKKTEKKQRTLFCEQRELHMFDGYHYSCVSDQTPKVEEGIIKSKSRALQIYSNLKKMKQPISPGGRVANFLNSLFTAGQTKKTKSTSSSIGGYEDGSAERKLKSGQASTCSSASSFSRSCLSKNSPSTREKLRNGIKRSVRFYPVSVIVDEDCQPCGHKSLYAEQEAGLMPVTVPTAWKIGRSPSRKAEEEIKLQVLEKSRRVEEAAREFLKDCHRNSQVKSHDLVSKVRNINGGDDDDDDDDDAASCSSSDLFELDHLAVIGKERYLEELPVYETTHVRTNRAIANGLIM